MAKSLRPETPEVFTAPDEKKKEKERWREEWFFDLWGMNPPRVW
jgi:hypothetical protein